MAHKNIQMKKRAGSQWDNLYPITLDSNVFDTKGMPLSQKLANTADSLNAKIDNTADSLNAKIDKNHQELTNTVNSLNAKVNENHQKVTTQLGHIENKVNSEWINVKYPPAPLPPAIGDGVADDTEAIQQALNIAKDAGQVSIFIPSGIYKVTKKLIIYANTTILMRPDTIILRHHNASLFQNGPDGAEYSGYNGNGNIIIDGGVLDPNLLNYDYECSGINLSHAENIIIRNLTIKDIYAGHALDIAGVRNVLIENCKFIGYKNRADGSRYYAEAIQTGFATRGDFPAFGLHDGTVTTNVTVRNCYFGPSGTPGTTAWPCGIGHHGAVHDIWPNNIHIENNTFENCPFRAIRLYKFKDVYIRDNVFRNCIGGVIINTPSPGTADTVDLNGRQTGVSQPGENVIIEGNLFDGNGDGNVAVVSINGVEGYKTRSVKVLNNVFRNLNVPDAAAYVNFAEEVEFNGNKFFDSTRAIWILNSTNISFDKNDCDKMTREMIFAQTSNNVVVKNNKVKETGRSGIYFDKIVDGVIAGNFIEKCSTEESNTRSGIFVGNSSSKIKILNNIVPLSSNMYGIQVTTTCTEVISSNNDVSGITGAVSIPSQSGFDGLILVGLNGVKYKAVVNAEGQLELTEL